MRRAVALGPLVFAVVLFASRSPALLTPERSTLSTPAPQATLSILGYGGGTPVAASGAAEPQSLLVERMTLPPGAVTDARRQPGAMVLYVEQGTIEIVVRQGLVERVCASGTASPTPCAAEMGTPTFVRALPLDTPVLLRQGDYLRQFDTTEIAYRNPGNATAVVLISSLLPLLDIPSGGGCGGACK